ncbi:SRPBCC family protein [Halobacteriales archaeon Cl-PHB]
MQSVSVSETFDAPADAVLAEMEDVRAFMLGAGFDGVTVDGDRVTIANHVGLLTIELDLLIVDDPDHDLVYEQVDGIFSEMVTWYDVEATDDGGTTVAATTEFELDASLVGPILDATVIKRQRRKELTAQFDYLAEATGDA